MNRFRVDRLGDNTALMGNEVYELVEGCSLDLLPFEITERVYSEVEYRAALTELLDKQLLALNTRTSICWKKKGVN